MIISNIKKDTPLDYVLGLGAGCNKCGKCCSHGSGFVLESEIPKIAATFKLSSEEFKKRFLEEIEIFHTSVFKIKSLKKDSKPYGPCMFLERDLCKIHDIKPLHCRIGNCSDDGDDLHTWFILNYCLNIYDPESIRQYDSYVRTGGKVLEGAELEKLFKDKQELKRILSYKRFK